MRLRVGPFSRETSAMSRATTALAALLAAAVPFLLLLTWGHYSDPSVTFKGTALQSSFEIELIALSAVTVLVGAAGLLRQLHPAALLVCCIAMTAEAVLIAIEWNSHSALGPNEPWRWATPTLVLAVTLSGLGIAAWLGLLITRSPTGKKCPDCAERVRSSVIDCPKCGYHFALPAHLKRCGSCQRPVKAEARFCRFCKQRFDEPVKVPASRGS